MSTRVYIAISATSKTGNVVADASNYVYAATFASLNLALANATHGKKDITFLTGTDEIYSYDVFDSFSESSGFDTSTGFVITPVNTVTIRAAIGYENKGIIANGVKITYSNGYNFVNIVGANTFLLDLSFEFTGDQALGIVNSGGIVQRCISTITGNDYGSAVSFVGSGGGKIISCLAYGGNGAGFKVQDYAVGDFYNCTALNVGGDGFYAQAQYGGAVLFKNCMALDSGGIDFRYAPNNGSTHTNLNNASSDGTAIGLGSVTNRVAANEVINTTSGSENAHLKVATMTVGSLGVDLVSAGDLQIDEFKDIDNQPYTGFPIGFDQDGNVLFVTVINLSSTTLNFPCVVTKAAATLFSGLFDSNPKNLGNTISALTNSEAVEVSYLDYGNKYGYSVFVLTEYTTLMFMAQIANSNVTLTKVAAQALTGIVVDSALKTVTINNSRTQSEIYDFLQAYQSELANVSTLGDGEIFSTVLGNRFTILSSWKFIFNAVPNGAFDLVGTIEFNAVFNITSFNVVGTLYFDVAGTYSITNSLIDNVDTVDGVETVVIDPLGNTTITNNLDSANITVNSPQPTLTINGFPASSIVVINDLDSADPQEKGTELLRDNNATADISYIGVAGNLISISAYKSGYKRFYKKYTVASVDATFPITMDLETN